MIYTSYHTSEFITQPCDLPSVDITYGRHTNPSYDISICTSYDLTYQLLRMSLKLCCYTVAISYGYAISAILIIHRIFTLGRARYCRSMRPPVRPSACPERRYHSNALRISAISLKFGGMMHSTMKQYRYFKWLCSANFARLTELWKFPR